MRTLFILATITIILKPCFSLMEDNGQEWLNNTLGDLTSNAVKIQIQKEEIEHKNITVREPDFLKDTREAILHLARKYFLTITDKRYKNQNNESFITAH